MERKTKTASAKPRGKASAQQLHVSLVALPDASVSTLFGIFDTMDAYRMMGAMLGRTQAPFRVEIVGEQAGTMKLSNGLPIEVQRSIDELDRSDIVIVPSLMLRGSAWRKGRYPKLTSWLRAMHRGGALLCSACSGIFLLAETGAWDGKDTAVHFGYAGAFATCYPGITVHPERVLVIAGARDELVTSGASTTWHDMVLYLIARFVGASAAQEIARTFALQWHKDGLAPYMVFEGKGDHGDGEIQSAQKWLAENFAIANPVEAMIQRSKLAERTFKRRFTAATGLAPLEYVQRLRIEDAKRRLERSDDPVDEISWRVGYEDAAFFRRLFKRITEMSPGAYRKRFRIPDFARPGASGRRDDRHDPPLPEPAR